MLAQELLKDVDAAGVLPGDLDQLPCQHQSRLRDQSTLRKTAQQQAKRLRGEPLGVELLIEASHIPERVIAELRILIDGLAEGK